jgi:hypothetical protein
MLLLLLILYKPLPNFSFALSPSFGHQEIRDKGYDWVDMKKKTVVNSGEPSTDIIAINYFSDGKILNATVWLLFPFKERPSNETGIINYGMLVDSDFNKETGFDGIDYKIEISWDNHTNTWNRVFQQWSPYGNERILDIKHNFTGFFEKEGYYILLSADLDSMFYPDKYKVIFYAQSNKDGDPLIDFSRWVAIPHPGLSISTSPNSVKLRQGEQKTIEVQVNATKGFEPSVHLFTTNRSADLKSSFKFDTLPIPSYGIATTPLTITASRNATVYPYSLLIFANSTFPDEEFNNINSSMVLPDSIKSENINSTSSLAVTILPPLTWQEQISEFWDKLGSPLTFVYGVIAVSVPLILNEIRKKLKKNRRKDTRLDDDWSNKEKNNK